MSVKPGFKDRLLDAMRANGLETAEDLSSAIHVPLEKAKRLLETDLAVDVDCVTLFRICDRTQFSGRWLIRAELPPTIRIVVSPDDKWWLDSVHALSEADLGILSAALQAMLEKTRS
jgi:hypothetical protein